MYGYSNSERSANDPAQRLPAHLVDLSRPEAWPHGVGVIEVIETHISWVVLTGEWAYKIKRPVNLGFVDYTTLEKRKAFCEEEVRLNRLYSDNIYDGVSRICASAEGVAVDGPGEVVEYAVRMHQFPATSHVLTFEGQLHCDNAALRKFGSWLGTRHESMAPEPPENGDSATQFGLLRDAANGVRDVAEDALTKRVAKQICDHVEQQMPNYSVRMIQRAADDRIRECHGDLHLGNLLQIDGELHAFDALEFDRSLRVTDVAADIAFLCMDLEAHGYVEESHSVLSGWLESTGDYGALAVLDFYRIYRALVRARVNALMLSNTKDSNLRTRLTQEVHRYLATAARILEREQRPSIYVMRGVSGTGKSTLARKLEPELKAIWIRSDVQRKRDHEADYSNAGRQLVYQQMLTDAIRVLDANRSVLLDATFLKLANCEHALQAAHQMQVPILFIDLTAPDDVLEARVVARAAQRSDVSEADVDVLRDQLSSCEALGEKYSGSVIGLDTNTTIDAGLLAQAMPWLARLEQRASR